MVREYIPKQKDIVFLNLNPVQGHEQKGYQPLVVISKNVFNDHTKMVILCPISSNSKYYPTHYELQDTSIVKGSVLCEHVISLDYEKRKLKYVETLNDTDFDKIKALVQACF
jgi:mRNA interferase MazF